MTDEQRNDSGRLDLRALGLQREGQQAREDAVIADTLRRLPPRVDDISPLLLLRRRIGFAAAALILIAGASLWLSRTGERPMDGESQLLAWARSGHVPTNGELLAVYQGYQP